MKALPATAIERFRRDRDKYDALKVLLDGLNEVRAALEAGTYAPEVQYRRWGSIFCPSWEMRDGGTAPAFSPFPGAYTPQFQVNASLHSGMQIPLDFLPGSALYPRLVTSFSAAPVSGEVVNWLLTFNVGNPNADYPVVPGQYAAAYVAEPSDYYRIRRVKLQAVGGNLEPLAQVNFVVSRSAGATSIDPHLLGIEWLYQKGPFGAEEMP